MPFIFRGIRKHPDQSCYVAQFGKSQELFERCDTVAQLREAVKERFREDDDDMLALMLMRLALQQPNPLQWLKAIEGKRISLDLAAAIKIQEPV